MPFPPELLTWFPSDLDRGRVRVLGMAKVQEVIDEGSDDPASIPGTLAALAGLPIVQGKQCRLSPHILQ